MSLPEPTGARIDRPNFVLVGSPTVRNTRLSYRALGLLTYLLDQAEGWVVRSEQLCKGEGREGREAVRTALHELAAQGHYRLERRRLLSGKVVMGTAISHAPKEQWIRDNELFGGKKDPAVPVVQQPDGTFLVQYPDGTFGPDGFDPDPPADEEPPADPDPQDSEGDPPAGEEPPGVPEKPAARPRRPRRTPAQKATDDAAKAAEKQRKEDQKATWEQEAEQVAKWWWDDAEKHFGKYVGRNNGYLAMRNMVKRALAAGYTKRQCADALRHARKHLPSAQQWQTALGVAANHIVPSRPNERVPYSDRAAWGDQSDTQTSTPGHAPGTGTDDSDNATFGVIERS